MGSKALDSMYLSKEEVDIKEFYTTIEKKEMKMKIMKAKISENL